MPTQFSPCEIIQRAFPGIHEQEAEEMASTGVIRSYPAGTTLCHEDMIENTFYILLDGNVQVTKLIDTSQARTLKNLSSGDFFGEMALIQNAPRAATVTTTSDTTVLEINKENFDDLLTQSTSVSRAMVREVSRRLRENDKMAIEDLRLKAGELATAYQHLAEMDYARREFLTTIAHELRTPLTAASGFLQVINMGLVQGEAFNSALDTVTRNVQQIISLVNDILFLQEMDLILVDFTPVDLGALIASVVEQQRNHAKRNQVGLNLSIAPNLPAVMADSKGLERAMRAILDNAIKFSPDGGDVQVEVLRHEKEIWTVIRDHGVGIPAEAIPHIFDRFFRLDEVNGHMFRGIGLGLSIARQVILQHHGQIEVISELGKGSTFTIRLPLTT